MIQNYLFHSPFWPNPSPSELNPIFPGQKPANPAIPILLALQDPLDITNLYITKSTV